MSGPATFDQQEVSSSDFQAQQPAARDLAIVSHDAFRQAMMERLRVESQHLTHANGTVQGRQGPPAAHPSVSSPAQGYQHALSQPPGMQVYSTVSPWTGSGKVLSTDLEACGGAPNKHVLGEPVAAVSAGSPASRALQSIRSMLHSLPESPGSVHAESALADAAKGASTRHTAAVSSGVRQMSTSQVKRAADQGIEDAAIRPSQDGAAVFQETSPRLCGTLSGVEREVVRILGPRFGSADMSPHISRIEMTRAKSGSDGGLARASGGRCVLLCPLS